MINPFVEIVLLTALGLATVIVIHVFQGLQEKLEG